MLPNEKYFLLVNNIAQLQNKYIFFISNTVLKNKWYALTKPQPNPPLTKDRVWLGYREQTFFELV